MARRETETLLCFKTGDSPIYWTEQRHDAGVRRPQYRVRKTAHVKQPDGPYCPVGSIPAVCPKKETKMETNESPAEETGRWLRRIKEKLAKTALVRSGASGRKRHHRHLRVRWRLAMPADRRPYNDGELVADKMMGFLTVCCVATLVWSIQRELQQSRKLPTHEDLR